MSEPQATATKTRRARRSFLLAAVLALVAVGVVFACVPADTRPEPASLFVTVGASEPTRGGITTADGWSLAFDRVLVGVGRTTISSSCARYSESSYDRVVELSKRGPQKLAVLYGIGHCDLRFRVGTPSSEAIVGEGATDDDKTFMRTRGADRWVSRGGVVLDVAGVARKGGAEKTFRFVFRSSIRYSGCSTDGNSAFVLEAQDAGDDDEPDASITTSADAAIDGEPPPPVGIGVVLEGGAALEQALTFDVEELFLAGDGKTLRFDPYAAADTDQNGAITLDELARVPITTVFDGGPFETSTFGSVIDAGGRGGRKVTVSTLGDYLYLVLLPRLLRYGDGGACASGLGVDFGRDAGDGGATGPR